MSDLKPVSGIDVIYLYRILKDAAKEAAWKLAFTTDNGTTESKSADTVTTKDGTIRKPGNLETDISATTYLPKGDESIKKLRQAMINDEVIEIWEINKADENDAGKYAAVYYQGYCTNIEKSSGSEDYVGVSLSFAINGIGQDGYTELTEEQAEVVQYAFKDAAKQPGGA